MPRSEPRRHARTGPPQARASIKYDQDFWRNGHGVRLMVFGDSSQSTMWQGIAGSYGDRFAQVALTVGMSLIGIVLFGTIAGSMFPLMLRACGLDPASASAPAVATLVDVSGLIIYFSFAKLFLLGGHA